MEENLHQEQVKKSMKKAKKDECHQLVVIEQKKAEKNLQK